MSRALPALLDDCFRQLPSTSSCRGKTKLHLIGIVPWILSTSSTAQWLPATSCLLIMNRSFTLFSALNAATSIAATTSTVVLLSSCRLSFWRFETSTSLRNSQRDFLLNNYGFDLEFPSVPLNEFDNQNYYLLGDSPVPHNSLSDSNFQVPWMQRPRAQPDVISSPQARDVTVMPAKFRDEKGVCDEKLQSSIGSEFGTCQNLEGCLMFPKKCQE